MASGTIAYHVALGFGLSRLALALCWLGLTAGALVGIQRLRSGPVVVEGPPTPPLAHCTLVLAFAVGAAVAAYLWAGSPRGWWAFWACAVVSLGLAVRHVFGHRLGEVSRSIGPRTGVGLAVIFVLAGALAIAALVTNRPDLDDVYVVNRSVYVEQHGNGVPQLDTLFSDHALPGQRAPLRSPAFEVLMGVVAAALPVDAASVLYFGVAPLTAALSVLVVWRLARTLCCRTPVLVVLATVLFLVLDGSVHGGFGNFSFGRLWQGKVVLTAVLVPLIWSYAVRWSRDGSRRDLGLLVAANVAAAGLSSTALFVAPLATGAVALGPAVLARAPWRLLAAALATTYPTTLALLNRAADSGLDTAPLDTSAMLAPWSRWAFVFGKPVVAVAALALALAWLAARDRGGRAVLAVAPLLVLGTLYGPRALDPLRSLAPGASVILWRAVWVLPVPALVGMVATVPWTLARRSRVLAGGTGAVVVAAFGVFAVTTTPVVSDRNNAAVGRPQWKTGGETGVAQRLVDEATIGARVAGPFDVDRVVPLITSRVQAVDPRPGWYAHGIDPQPRRLVQGVLTHGLADTESESFVVALARLDVDVVALPLRLRDNAVQDVLARAGFVLRGVEEQYLILKRGTRDP